MARSIEGQGAIGPPSARIFIIPALAEQVVRLADQGLAGGAFLGRSCCKDRGHGTRAPQLLCKRLAVAARERHGWCLGAMSGIFPPNRASGKPLELVGSPRARGNMLVKV